MGYVGASALGVLQTRIGAAALDFKVTAHETGWRRKNESTDDDDGRQLEGTRREGLAEM
jgi:hypothetical protein